MEGKDAAAKSRARRSQTSASQPGVEAIRGDEAARFDDRINSKREGKSGSATVPATSRPGTQSVRGEEAARLDERIAAKQGRSSSKNASAQLADLESEVTAKTRARPATRASAPGVSRGNQLTQLEQDIAAKTRAGGSRRSGTSSSRGARTELEDLEARISVKTREANRAYSTTDTAREDLDTLERRIADKSKENHVRSSNTVPKKAYEPNPAAEGFDHEFEKMKAEGTIDSKSVFDAPPESAPVVTTADRGLVNQPDVEYGVYGGGNHGFADQGLAVAVAVSQDEEDAFIPSAIEYDPDSKPPIYKNRRFRFYLIAASILLVVIGVGASLGAVKAINKDNEAPTAAPTSLREGRIVDQLEQLVGEASLSDHRSPHYKALQWIVEEDPEQLEPEADNLIQRYLLALFYLSTSTPEKGWLSCNPPLDDETSVCNFTKLAQVYPDVAYENVPWGRWLSDLHECGWAGVFCDEFNQTRAIELPGQEIRGTFPSEISLMPYLQSLTFNWNEFYGTMPSELASMKHLLNIELHYNFFTGQVPPEWYKAQALQRINFAGNFLSGTIPTEIGELSTMKGFFSFENSIGGTIPTEIGDMKFLSFTRWSRNFMTGTIPSEVGRLEKLQEAWLHRNQFTGVLPSEMGNMKDMGDLRLHFNLFTGTIPEEHYNMPQLRRWDLYDCNFTSTISTTIGTMDTLQTYRIRNNNFYGAIPSELGGIEGLDSLWLHQNDLTGSVPFEVCGLRGPAGLVVLDVDCGPTNGIGAPIVDCMLDCCTACCDTVTGYCLRENGGTELTP